MSSATRSENPRTRPKDRDDYLEAARVVIARDGAASARMLDIAREAGITSSGLLHHFGSRHNLLTAAVVQKDERWLADFDRYARNHGPEQQLTHAIDALLNPPRAERGAWRRDWSVWFEAWTLALHDDQVATVCRTQERQWVTLFSAMISAGVDTGQFELSMTTPTKVAEELMALVDGLAMRLLIPGSTLSHRGASDRAKKAALRSCAAALQTRPDAAGSRSPQ
jgi:AcrR family transcriptional regulator